MQQAISCGATLAVSEAQAGQAREPLDTAAACNTDPGDSPVTCVVCYHFQLSTLSQNNITLLQNVYCLLVDTTLYTMQDVAAPLPALLII